MWAVECLFSINGLKVSLDLKELLKFYQHLKCILVYIVYIYAWLNVQSFCLHFQVSG